MKPKKDAESKDFESKLEMIGLIKKNSSDGMIELCVKNPTKFIEVTFPLELTRWQEVAFWAGNTERLGKGSLIWESFFHATMYEPSLVPLIFGFNPCLGKDNLSEKEQKEGIDSSESLARALKIFLPESLSQSESKQSFDVGDSKLSTQPVETYSRSVKPLNEEKYSQFLKKIDERIQLIIAAQKNRTEEMARDEIEKSEYSRYRDYSKKEKEEHERKKESVRAKHERYKLENAASKREQEWLKGILAQKRFLNPEFTLTQCIKAAGEVQLKRYNLVTVLTVEEIATLIRRDIPNFDTEEHVSSCFSAATKMIEDVGPESETKANFQGAIEQLKHHISQKATSDRLVVATALKKYVKNVTNNCDRSNYEKNFKKFSKEFRDSVQIIEAESNAVFTALLGAVVMAAAAFLLTLIPGSFFLAAHPYATIGGALFGFGVGLYAANKEVVRKLVSDKMSSELIDAGRFFKQARAISSPSSGALRHLLPKGEGIIAIL